MSQKINEDPTSDDFPTGLGIGELVPDFTLPDQLGHVIRFSEYRAGGRALLLFFRSASW
jgi:peroxiredoxin